MADFIKFPTPREQVISRGNTTAGIIPDICLVSHFQVGPWQILYRPEETGNVKRWGLPLMIPNFSRLKDGVFQEKGTSLPIHGFGRLLSWTITEQNASSLTMQLTSSDATRSDYPYEFTFTANIQVSEETLTYTLTMQNRSSEDMPIAPGVHPYFAIAQQQKSQLITEGLPGFNASTIDWDNNPPDTAYPFPQRVIIHFPQRGTLTIAELPQDDQYALTTMQVWSEPISTPDHDFVCFEPTVGTEDALNRPADRLTITPGNSRTIVLQLQAKPM